MPFYYLHDKQIEPKSVKDFKYIFYSDTVYKRRITIKFTEEADVSYCQHKIEGGIIQWNVDDEIINILGHEGIIKGVFKKTASNKNFELWLNTEYGK